MTAEERQRLKELGKDAYIREEMVRLGYWPPTPEIAARSEAAERALQPLYEELVGLRRELSTVNKELSEIGDVPRLLAEIRTRRIERVRAARAVRKVERQKEGEEKRQRDTLWRKVALPYLGRGVSDDLTFTGGDTAQRERNGLPTLETPAALAQVLGLTERELTWLCFHRTAAGADHYARFTIPKKRGGLRVLSSPKRKLRLVQGWIAREVLGRLPVHPAAHAFAPGASIAKNATPHTDKAVVVKVDLKDFFPSLGFKRVRAFFIGLGYNPGIATVLGLLCTDSPRVAVTFDGNKRFVAVGQRGLPQGALTSPVLSNLLARRLDARLTGAAKSLGFVYTRYADDLTFSHASEKAPVGILLRLVREIVASERLTVNEEKTQVLRPSDRQIVTGLVVNGASTPRVERAALRRFRALLHHCQTEGIESVSQRQGRDIRAYARGYLAFIRMASPEVAEKLAAAHPWLVE